MAVLGIPYTNTDGKPACIPAERQQGKWPNNFDPTRYWFCAPAPSTASAVDIECDAGEAFNAATLTCVPWGQWQWHPYVNPPSQQ